MLQALPGDARALLAAGVLSALPGMLVVRSPWRAMPLLSLSFWVLSWTWPVGSSRTRWLEATLAAFAALAVLRLLRPGPWPRPGRAQFLLVAVVAATAAVLYLVTEVPLDPRLPLEALRAELLSWRDGWPASFEPLLPVRPFQAGGFATLAGDVILLSHAPAHRAAIMVTLLSPAVFALALWSLGCTLCMPVRAVVPAALGAVLVAVSPSGPAAMAAAFAIQAVALGRDRRGIPSAVAAGACAAAGFATDVTTTVATLVIVIAIAGAPRPPVNALDGRGSDGRRLRVALVTCLVLSLPVALRTRSLDPPSPAPLAALGIAMVLCRRSRSAAGRARWIDAATALVATGLLLRGATQTVAAGLVAPSRDEVEAMDWIRTHSRPLDVVCAPASPAARWIPAIAGRATTVSVAPGWPASTGPCAVWISLSGAVFPGARPLGPPAFGTATAQVWTRSQDR